MTMSLVRGSEPAFPLPRGNENIDPKVGGLTKREFIAAMAVQGLLTNQEWGRPDNPHAIVAAAVLSADCLLAELDKGATAEQKP